MGLSVHHVTEGSHVPTQTEDKEGIYYRGYFSSAEQQQPKLFLVAKVSGMNGE